MNSLKSASSFAKSTPVAFDQFQQDVEPFLWCQVRIELIIGTVGVFETAKDLNDAVHGMNFTM
jgi:hypothetical protein